MLTHANAKQQLLSALPSTKLTSPKKSTQHVDTGYLKRQKTDVKKFRCRVCHEILVSRAAYGEHLKKEHWNSKETSEILKEISESSMNELTNMSTSSARIEEST